MNNSPIDNDKNQPRLGFNDYEDAVIAFLNDKDVFIDFINGGAGKFVPRFSGADTLTEHQKKVLQTDKIYPDETRALRPYLLCYNKFLNCYCLYYLTANQKHGVRYTGGFLEVPQKVYTSVFHSIKDVKKDKFYHDENSYGAVDTVVGVPVPISLISFSVLSAPTTLPDHSVKLFFENFNKPQDKNFTKRILSGESSVWHYQYENGQHMGDKMINPSVAYLVLVQNYLYSLAMKKDSEHSIKTAEFYLQTGKLLKKVNEELIRFFSDSTDFRKRTINSEIIKEITSWLSNKNFNISCLPLETKLFMSSTSTDAKEQAKSQDIIKTALKSLTEKINLAKTKAEKIQENQRGRTNAKRKNEKQKAQQLAEITRGQKFEELKAKKVINRAIMLYNELYYDATKLPESVIGGYAGRVKEHIGFVNDSIKSTTNFQQELKKGKSAESLMQDMQTGQGDVFVAELRNSFGSSVPFNDVLEQSALRLKELGDLDEILDENGKNTIELFNIISKLKQLSPDNLAERVYKELGTKRTKLTPKSVGEIRLDHTNTARKSLDNLLEQKTIVDTFNSAIVKEDFYYSLKRLIQIYTNPNTEALADTDGAQNIFDARDSVINLFNEYYADFYTAEPYKKYEPSAIIKQKAVNKALEKAKSGIKSGKLYEEILNDVKNFLYDEAVKMRAEIDAIDQNGGHIDKIEELDKKCLDYCRRFDAFMVAIDVMKQEMGDDGDEVPGHTLIKHYLAKPLEEKFPHMQRVHELDKDAMVDAVAWVSDILSGLSDRMLPFDEVCYDYTDDNLNKCMVSSECNELLYALNAMSNEFLSPKQFIEDGIDIVHEKCKKVKAPIKDLLDETDKYLSQADGIYKKINAIKNRYEVARKVKEKINTLYALYDKIFVDPNGAKKTKFVIDLAKGPLSEISLEDSFGKLNPSKDWFLIANSNIKSYINGIFIPYYIDWFSSFMLQDTEEIRKSSQGGTRYFVNSKHGTGEVGEQIDLSVYLDQFITYLKYIDNISEMIDGAKNNNIVQYNKLRSMLEASIKSTKTSGSDSASVDAKKTLDTILFASGDMKTIDRDRCCGKLILALAREYGGDGLMGFQAGVLHLIDICKTFNEGGNLPNTRRELGAGLYNKCGKVLGSSSPMPNLGSDSINVQ